MSRIWACALLVPATALGDDYVPDLPAMPPPPPSFVMLDRADTRSRVGIEMSYALPHTDDGTSASAMRYEVHGQYVDLTSGLGGYITMPISHLSETFENETDSVTGIGDLEIGGIFVRDFPKYGVTIAGHGGISLPTGSTDDFAYAANFVAAITRLPDLYLALPEATSVRIGTSPIWRSGRVFARADFGLDINSEAHGIRIDDYLRADVGVGIDLDLVSLTAELANAYVYIPPSMVTPSNADGSQWIDTAALAARFHAGLLEPYAAIVIPLDHDSYAYIYVAFTLGFDVRLR